MNARSNTAMSVSACCLSTLAASYEEAHASFESAKLTDPVSSPLNEFARSVDVDGDTAVVGRQGFAACASPRSAYIYAFNGAVWSMQAQFTGPGGFAADVAASGDCVIVGAPFSGNGSPNFNAAYVYRKTADVWALEAVLTPADDVLESAFGWSVDLDGDVAVIGALRTDESCPGASGCDSGSAYVFRFDGAQWSQEAKLSASDAQQGDLFGAAVSVRGNDVLIGAPGANADGAFAGLAYMFSFDGDSWDESARLVASDGAANDRFGSAVALCDEFALVGAPLAHGAGAAYAFQLSASGYSDPAAGAYWTETAILDAPDDALSEFGTSLSVFGRRAVIGARFGDGDAGQAFAYHFSGDAWQSAGSLRPLDGEAGDRFGLVVAMDGQRAIVGAPRNPAMCGEAAPASTGASAAYVFSLCPSDLNADGRVNASDLSMLLSAWGDCPDGAGCAADLTNDGNVDGLDLSHLLASWGGD